MSAAAIHDAQAFGEQMASDLLGLVEHLNTQREVGDAYLQAVQRIAGTYSGDMLEAASIGFTILLLGCEHLPVDYIQTMSDKVTIFTSAPRATQ